MNRARDPAGRRPRPRGAGGGGARAPCSRPPRRTTSSPGMTYRYLAPTDEVALISMPSGGHYVTEVVVALADEEGSRFTVRGPVSPREVARLLHMFHESNLQVTFTAEHEFLLALDAEGDHHRRPLLPAGLGRPDAHGEDCRRPASTAARGSPTGSCASSSAGSGPAGCSGRDRLLPARVPAALRVPNRPDFRRPDPRPGAEASGVEASDDHAQDHLEAHRLHPPRGGAVRQGAPSAPRTSSRSPAPSTPSASSTSR